METQTSEQPTQTENNRQTATMSEESEWISPEFVDQSACAEICAYIFSV